MAKLLKKKWQEEISLTVFLVICLKFQTRQILKEEITSLKSFSTLLVQYLCFIYAVSMLYLYSMSHPELAIPNQVISIRPYVKVRIAKPE